MAALQVTLGDVVCHAVTENMLEGGILTDGPTRPTDDDRHLCFVVPLGRQVRIERDIVSWPYDRARPLGEEGRSLRSIRRILTFALAFRLLEMVPVVPSRRQDVAVEVL